MSKQEVYLFCIDHLTFCLIVRNLYMFRRGAIYAIGFRSDPIPVCNSVVYML